MDEYVTESGLLVTDRRARAAPNDPRNYPPNANLPVGTVGPNVPAGFGDVHAMYPEQMRKPPVQAWQGWPTEWSTPNWGSTVGPAEAAARVSVVFGALDLNASILGTMPPYRLTGGQPAPLLPWMVNPQPEVYTGWIEAFKQVVLSYMAGEAFLWCTSRYRDGVDGAPGSVRNWVLLDPAWIKIEMSGQIRRYWMRDVEITDDVLHLRYQSWPGQKHGIGPLEALASNLFGAAALERYQSQLAVRGGIPWGVLTVPGNLNQDQATALRDNFVAARLSANGAPAVMSGGARLDALYINPKDMALLELRQFDEARIATLLGVPPTLLSLPTGDTSMTYRNVEGVYDFHWRSSLRPKAAFLTEAISQWALPRGQSIELNRDEYVRPAMADRMTAWQTAFNIYDPVTGQRAMTIDEIRAAERLSTRFGPTETSGAQPALERVEGAA